MQPELIRIARCCCRKLLRPAGLLLVMQLAAFGSLGSPVLSEFMADDADGAPDWIEISNPTDATVDLAGWQLRDADTTWLFPDGATIVAQGYLVVFATGSANADPRDARGNYHAGFRLSRDG